MKNVPTKTRCFGCMRILVGLRSRAAALASSSNLCFICAHLWLWLLCVGQNHQRPTQYASAGKLLMLAHGGRDAVTGHGWSRLVSPSRAWSRPFKKKKIVYFFYEQPQNSKNLIPLRQRYSPPDGAWSFSGAWMLVLGASFLRGGRDAVTRKAQSSTIKAIQAYSRPPGGTHQKRPLLPTASSQQKLQTTYYKRFKLIQILKINIQN